MLLIKITQLNHILSFTKLANHPLCLSFHFGKEVFELAETNATFPIQMSAETPLDFREKIEYLKFTILPQRNKQMIYKTFNSPLLPKFDIY